MPGSLRWNRKKHCALAVDIMLYGVGYIFTATRNRANITSILCSQKQPTKGLQNHGTNTVSHGFLSCIVQNQPFGGSVRASGWFVCFKLHFKSTARTQFHVTIDKKMWTRILSVTVPSLWPSGPATKAESKH